MSLIIGDIDGKGGPNQDSDVISLVRIMNKGNLRTDGSGTGIPGTLLSDKANIIKAENSYGIQTAYHSFAKNGYVNYVGDINNTGGWPDDTDVIKLVNIMNTAAAPTPYTATDARSEKGNELPTHPTLPLIGASNNTIALTFPRSLKTLDDATPAVSLLNSKYYNNTTVLTDTATVVAAITNDTNNLSVNDTDSSYVQSTQAVTENQFIGTHNRIDYFAATVLNETDFQLYGREQTYGGVRLTDFQLYNSSDMIGSYENPSSLAFSNTTVTNDTLTLTFNTLPTNATSNKYWLKFIPRRDSDNLGISLTYNNFLFDDSYQYIKEGVFIYGFTGGGTDGLTLTSGGGTTDTYTINVDGSNTMMSIKYGQQLNLVSKMIGTIVTVDQNNSNFTDIYSFAAINGDVDQDNPIVLIHGTGNNATITSIGIGSFDIEITGQNSGASYLLETVGADSGKYSSVKRNVTISLTDQYLNVAVGQTIDLRDYVQIVDADPDNPITIVNVDGDGDSVGDIQLPIDFIVFDLISNDDGSFSPVGNPYPVVDGDDNQSIRVSLPSDGPHYSSPHNNSLTITLNTTTGGGGGGTKPVLAFSYYSPYANGGDMFTDWIMEESDGTYTYERATTGYLYISATPTNQSSYKFEKSTDYGGNWEELTQGASTQQAERWLDRNAHHEGLYRVTINDDQTNMSDTKTLGVVSTKPTLIFSYYSTGAPAIEKSNGTYTYDNGTGYLYISVTPLNQDDNYKFEKSTNGGDSWVTLTQTNGVASLDRSAVHEGLYRVTINDDQTKMSDNETLVFDGLRVKFSYSIADAGDIQKNSVMNYEWTNGVLGYNDNYIYVKASGNSGVPVFEKAVESPPIITGATMISIKQRASGYNNTPVATYKANTDVTWNFYRVDENTTNYSWFSIDGNGNLTFNNWTDEFFVNYKFGLKATSKINGLSSEMDLDITVVDDTTVEILGPSTFEIVEGSDTSTSFAQFDIDHETANLSLSETSGVDWVTQVSNGVLSISPPSGGLTFNDSGSNTYNITVNATVGATNLSKDVTIEVIKQPDLDDWQTVAKDDDDEDNYLRFYRSSNSIVGRWRVQADEETSSVATIIPPTWLPQKPIIICSSIAFASGDASVWSESPNKIFIEETIKNRHIKILDANNNQLSQENGSFFYDHNTSENFYIVDILNQEIQGERLTWDWEKWNETDEIWENFTTHSPSPTNAQKPWRWLELPKNSGAAAGKYRVRVANVKPKFPVGANWGNNFHGYTNQLYSWSEYSDTIEIGYNPPAITADKVACCFEKLGEEGDKKWYLSFKFQGNIGLQIREDDGYPGRETEDGVEISLPKTLVGEWNQDYPGKTQYYSPVFPIRRKKVPAVDGGGGIMSPEDGEIQVAVGGKYSDPQAEEGLSSIQPQKIKKTKSTEGDVVTETTFSFQLIYYNTFLQSYTDVNDTHMVFDDGQGTQGNHEFILEYYNSFFYDSYDAYYGDIMMEPAAALEFFDVDDTRYGVAGKKLVSLTLPELDSTTNTLSEETAKTFGICSSGGGDGQTPPGVPGPPGDGDNDTGGVLTTTIEEGAFYRDYDDVEEVDKYYVYFLPTNEWWEKTRRAAGSLDFSDKSFRAWTIANFHEIAVKTFGGEWNTEFYNSKVTHINVKQSDPGLNNMGPIKIKGSLPGYSTGAINNTNSITRNGIVYNTGKVKLGDTTDNTDNTDNTENNKYFILLEVDEETAQNDTNYAYYRIKYPDDGNLAHNHGGNWGINEIDPQLQPIKAVSIDYNGTNEDLGYNYLFGTGQAYISTNSENLPEQGDSHYEEIVITYTNDLPASIEDSSIYVGPAIDQGDGTYTYHPITMRDLTYYLNYNSSFEWWIPSGDDWVGQMGETTVIGYDLIDGTEEDHDQQNSFLRWLEEGGQNWDTMASWKGTTVSNNTRLRDVSEKNYYWKPPTLDGTPIEITDIFDADNMSLWGSISPKQPIEDFYIDMRNHTGSIYSALLQDAKDNNPSKDDDFFINYGIPLWFKVKLLQVFNGNETYNSAIVNVIIRLSGQSTDERIPLEWVKKTVEYPDGFNSVSSYEVPFDWPESVTITYAYADGSNAYLVGNQDYLYTASPASWMDSIASSSNGNWEYTSSDEDLITFDGNGNMVWGPLSKSHGVAMITIKQTRGTVTEDYSTKREISSETAVSSRAVTYKITVKGPEGATDGHGGTDENDETTGHGGDDPQ